jgi:branched chain amino acid efflux pump
VTAWIVVVAVGVITALYKAAGPVLLGGRKLTGRTLAVVELIGPVLLVALVVTQTFGAHRSIVVDARLAGVGAALVALLFRAPLIVAMIFAAVVTVLVRHL